MTLTLPAGITPYYQQGNIAIFHGRCQDVLPSLSGVDLILTDPPFAEQTHAGAATHPTRMAGGDGHSPRKLLDFDSITFADLHAIFSLFGPTGVKWIVSFMDWHHIYQMEQTPPDGLRFVRFGMWDKPNGAPQFTGDRPSQGWEGIAIMHRLGGRMRWNGGGHRAVWRENKISHPLHKTAKPPALVGKLMTAFSQPGDTVLDCFMGIGTTLIEAKRLGRKAIGIELNERYINAAINDLQQEAMDLAS